MKQKDAQHLLSSLLNYFTTTYKVELSDSSNIKLNSKTFTPRQFHTYFTNNQLEVATSIGKQEFYGLLEYIGNAKKCSELLALDDLSSRLFTTMQTSMQSAEKKKLVDMDSDGMLKNQFDWSGYVPVIDILSNISIMYNTRDKEVNRMVSYDSWKNWVMSRESKSRALLLEQTMAASISYNPFDAVDVYYKSIGSQKDVLHLNAHNFPTWRRKPLENPKLPKLFLELMNHLFPNAECRKYVYHWLNFSMTSRNHCYLFLHGEQGIGKNTFSAIAEALVGMGNFSKVDPKIFDDARFNDYLHFTRLVFLDEVIINKGNVTRIRSLTNSTAMIEGKNLKAVYCTNHASFIIANNTDKRNLVTYDDRRFSVPELTKEPIKNTLGQEWLDQFYTALEQDEDFIANIGHWILQQGDSGEYNEKQPYLTDTFYDMVEKSLAQWQLQLVSLIEARQFDMIEISALKEELDVSNIGRVTISGFLENHRDRDGDIYGSIVQKKNVGKRYLQVAEKYMPEDNVETSDAEITEDNLEEEW